MHCEEALLLMSGYLDNENTQEEQAQLLEHLEHCETCRQVLENFRLADEGLLSMTQELPDGLHDRIMDAVRADAAPKKKKSPWLGILASAAAVALAVGLYGAVDRGVTEDAAAPMVARTTDHTASAYSMLDLSLEGKTVCEEFGAPVVVLHEAVQELEGLAFETLSDGSLLYTLKELRDAEHLGAIYYATVYVPEQTTSEVSYALIITEP